jgi:hypothetical protein
MSCSQLVEIEDLVLGTLEVSRTRELRAHVESCTACRIEQATVAKERALFTHREPLALPSEAIAVALRAQLTAEVRDPSNGRARSTITGARIGPARRGATRFVRRGASVVAGVLRRGHVSAACAAALFALVAFSKLGGAPILPASADDANVEPTPGSSGLLFSQSSLGGASSSREDDLACSMGAMTTFDKDTLVSSSGPTMREVLACGRAEGAGASCEPSVTCSSLFQ